MQIGFSITLLDSRHFYHGYDSRQTLSELENILAEGIIIKPFDVDKLGLQIAEISQGKTDTSLVTYC